MRGCRHFATLWVTLPPVPYRGLASSSRAELSAIPAHLLNGSMNAVIIHLQFLQCTQIHLGKVAGWHHKWNSGLRQMCPPNLSFLGHQIPQQCCPYSSHTWLAGGQTSHGQVKELTSSLWIFIIWNITAILISMFMDGETASVHYWSMTAPCLLYFFPRWPLTWADLMRLAWKTCQSSWQQHYLEQVCSVINMSKEL